MDLKPCYVRLDAPKNISTSDNEATPRKSTRNRNKPNKFGDFYDFGTPTRKREASISESEDDDEEIDETVSQQKPTALFTDDDVEGQNMFTFKKRHNKHNLQNKVKSAIINSPTVGSPKTPRKSLLARTERLTEATPKHVKEIMKKRIIREVDSDSAESDFSASSSDFVPEESENESESAASSSESEAVEEEPKKPTTKVPIKRGKDLKRPKDSEYIVTPDNYFMMNASKKITTSDHTLERLKNFNLNDNSDQNEEIIISAEHEQCINSLNNSYVNLFDRWLYVLSENFNIVLYGVGSKRAIVHKFQEEKLNDFPVVVVNGFFPGLTMKSILETIIVDLLECSNIPSNVGDVVSLIDSQLCENNMELVLIIHNIDGTMLRNAKAQAMLAGISQIKNVHTIATIDHINAPLLWDHTKLSKFSFTWWDVTTFQPYTEETSFENSLLSHRTGALQLSSLRSVYQSLTSNAKGIFNIIVKYQLEHQKQPHYQGLPFRELYGLCREQFLVSSDAALRAQLTEFLDHRAVRARRTAADAEALLVPLDAALLTLFLETQETG